MRRLFFLFITIALAFEFPLGASIAEKRDSDAQLLEVGQPAKLRPVAPPPASIKVISYNIRWRGGDDLKKLATLFKDDEQIGGAAILGLQEVDRNRKRTGNKNTARVLADELGMYYAWAAPPTPKSEKEEETGVAIMSHFPLSDVQRIVLPHEGPGKRRRVALGATVNIGDTPLRVYSVHAETRISVSKKIEQMKAVLEDLARFPHTMPAIVLGDFNTWEADAGEKTVSLFNRAGFQTPFSDKPTFQRRVLFFPLLLRLDWIWLRNLKSTSHGMDRDISLSDHWPLWITVVAKN